MDANKIKDEVKKNIDTKLLVTGVVTVFAAGFAIYAVSKMGKMGKQIAAIAKGGR
ncbi:hypothetical protein [Marinomonas atlantica]|uniref:hypothetical protein n=1 Tax=Marinomonas atlantica TaxID=1806668 RepID=UPI000A970377|nr:hypothetical protein [Marinomonas atlantica]